MSKIITAVLLVIVTALVTVYFTNPSGDLGGVTVGNEYIATSTKPYYSAIVDRSIRTGWGTLGSVTITGAGTTDFAFFDATTTVNSIDGFSTSTKMLAHFPASTAAGTYVFDVQYTDGLSLHVLTAGTGTSTVSYR